MRIEKTKAFFIIRLLFLFLIGAVYIYYTWTSAIQKTQDQATDLTEIVAAGFDYNYINHLEVTANDVNKYEYQQLKRNLSEIVSIYPNIHFAYLYTLQENMIYIMVDSEPVGSEDYSPPGQHYSEAQKIYYQVIQESGSIHIADTLDRWGSWKSVLLPLKDNTTGEVIAVLGIDYEPSDWYYNARQSTRLACFVVLCLLLLFYVSNLVKRNNEVLRKEKEKLAVLNNKLADQERLFRTLYEQSPYGITFGNYDNALANTNTMFEKIVGRTKEELHKLGWDAITYPDDLPEDLRRYEQFKIDRKGYSRVKRYIRPDQSYVWVNMTIAPLEIESSETYSYVCIIEDINNKVQAEKDLQKSERNNEMLLRNLPAMVYRCKNDEDGEVEALEGVIIDITERKQREDKINYLNYHDTLTGIYNRRYFEDKKQHLEKENIYPVSVIMGDINGLKFINDSFGHAAGDKLIIMIAAILKRNCRERDVLARTGGDEFSILLTDTTNEFADTIMKNIEAECNEFEKTSIGEAYHLSISLGCATKTTPDINLEDIIKDAEDDMYRHKMLQSRSLHSAIISSMKSTLFEKNQETEEHAQRLIKVSELLGQKMNLAEKQLNELELLSTLHDIGKIGISDMILKKPGKLTNEEWVEMKKHPEIGYRIAMSTAELSPIAECILSHHERWDGTGYPHGIKGEEIPLLARIIAVADAYDAMTEDRPYRKAMSKEEACEEIKKYAGIQFDPVIAELFLQEIINYT